MRRLLGLALSLSLWAVATSHARAEPAPAQAVADCATTAAAPAKLVDLNSADESALLALPGIGPARARAIIAYRTSHGAFHSLSQLLQIKGIGRALLKQLRPLVAVTPAPS